MKAQEIKSEIQEALNCLTPHSLESKAILFLGEIAYQLAVANECEAKKALADQQKREQAYAQVAYEPAVQPFVYPEIPVTEQECEACKNDKHGFCADHFPF